jgi:hypothetical protein
VTAIAIGKTLDMVADFNRRLDAFYVDIRDNSKDNGIRLLVYYLSHHRRKVDEVMSECVPEIIAGIRAIQLQNYICPTEMFLAIDTPVSELTGEALLKSALDYETALIHLHNLILEQPTLNEMRVISKELVDISKNHVAMLNKMQAMHYF